MNAVMKLVILVVTLLLVNNMAFASVCDQVVCYDVTKTYEDGATNVMTWQVCLNDDGTGNIDGSNPLALFGGGPVGFIFDERPRWVTWIMHSPNESGYIWTSVFGTYLNGEGYLIVQDKRWIVKGMKVPCPL